MSKENVDAAIEFHWMLDMIQSVDVGIVALDRQFTIKVWNGFMEAHSGMTPASVKGKRFYDVFPSLNQEWLSTKTSPVFDLGTRAFMTWEQRPYLIKFRNHRPITGQEPYMYQNVVIFPLRSVNGEIDHVCIMIYDVTDVASFKKHLFALEVSKQERASRD